MHLHFIFPKKIVVIDMIEQYKPQKNTEDAWNIFILKSVSLFNEILSQIIGKYLMTE